MRHQDLLVNHILESWTYADAAHRNAAGGFLAGDVGRISYQQDTGQYFRLTGVGPPATWELIGPQSVQGAAYAFLQIPQVSPNGTGNSTTGVMMGLGVGHIFTPTATGKVWAGFDGTLANTTGLKKAFATMYYGTGTPPVNGAATVGTVIGGTAAALATDPTAVTAFCVKGLIAPSGMQVGTNYWFDLGLKTDAGGFAEVFFVSGTFMELP